MPGIHLQTELSGSISGGPQPFELRLHGGYIIVGSAVGTGIQLNAITTGVARPAYLGRIRIGEQGNSHACLFQAMNNGCQQVVLRLKIPAMIRGSLRRVIGHQGDLLWLVALYQLQKILGGIPLNIEFALRKLSIDQVTQLCHISETGVTLVRARVHGEAVSAVLQSNSTNARDAGPGQITPVAKLGDGIEVDGQLSGHDADWAVKEVAVADQYNECLLLRPITLPPTRANRSSTISAILFRMFKHGPMHWPLGLIILLVKALHRALPYRLKLRLCRALGQAFYTCLGSRRRISDTNLALCFPNLSASERDSLNRETFRSWGTAILETAIGWWGKDDGQLDNLTTIGLHHFKEALAQDKGIILLGAHVITIDLAGTLLRREVGHELPMHAVYRPQNNTYLNEVMLEGRLRSVTSCVSRFDMRQIVRLVRRKEILWYAPDHDFGTSNSVFAPFFGHTASTLTTTARLAAIHGTPVMMMGHWRNPDDSGYTLEFWPALENFPTDDPLADATRVNQAIETAISRAPEQYMWFHKRFKTQPGLPKGAIYKTPPGQPANPSAQ